MNLSMFDEFELIAVIILIDIHLSSHWSMGGFHGQLSPFNMTVVVFNSFSVFWDNKSSRIIFYISYFRLGIFNFPQEPWLLLVQSGI